MAAETAYLVLQNGRVFEGRRIGAVGNAEGDAMAEIVFTTAMGGYLETLTDPSYFGQMVVQTFPLIGNYGFIPEDLESERPRLCAYIVSEMSEHPSNYRSQGALDSYLGDSGVIGLCGVDTRTLTSIIREFGTMNAAIQSVLPKDVPGFARELAQKNLSASVYEVSSTRPSVLNEGGSPHIALWDFGFKAAMAKALTNRGCKVTVMPAASTAEDILALCPDGVLLSNGPGDPAVNVGIIANLRRLTESGVPIMGICLGHQLLALALGAKTEKLKFGHRGANQPVRDTKNGRLFITSQNHGYAVVNHTLPKGADLWFENLNDSTCEGIEYTGFPAFSVQFHPEACAGPLDTIFLFDRFLSMIKGEPHAQE